MAGSKLCFEEGQDSAQVLLLEIPCFYFGFIVFGKEGRLGF